MTDRKGTGQSVTESPGKRGAIFNRSSGMSEVLGGAASPPRPVTASAVKSTPKEKSSPPPQLKITSPEKLCAKCLGEEMICHKHDEELWQKQKDLEDQQRLLEDLHRKEEEERRRRDAMQGEMKRAAYESLSASAKKRARPDTADDRHVLEQANAEYNKITAESKGKKAEDTAKYGEELRIQMEARKLAAKDAKEKDKAQELSNQGLSLDYYKGDKYKDAREQQKLILKQQMVDEQMRKSKDWDKDGKDRSQADELYASQERDKAEEERRRKAMTKADYEAYLKEKERLGSSKKEQRSKDQEENLERQKTVQEQMAREKLEDHEKKKSLGSYLISQMQDKSAKKAEKAVDEEVAEKSVRAPTASSPTKFNPKAVKEDNLRQIEELNVTKAHEKDLQRNADEKYLEREKQIEEERRRADQRKRDEERKNFEDARRSMENKRSMHMDAKLGDKDDLDYYERMNNEIKGQIKEDQAQSKGKLKEYSDALQKQMADNEEARRKQRELDLEKERASKGMSLDSYKRNDGPAKAGYKQAIKQQYNESLLKKDKGRADTEGDDSHHFMSGVLDESHLAEEEARKKRIQREAYERSMEKTKNSKQEGEDKKLAEQSQRLEESGKLKEDLDKERLRLRERQQKMNQELAAQMEAKKSKEKGDKMEWMDERAKKHAQEIEERVSKLKEEILRCIRCNAVIGKGKALRK